jgi:hypothetical protein
VYFRGLAWNFTAEVTAILVVIVIVGINAQRQTILMWQAVLVYPLLMSPPHIVPSLLRMIINMGVQ